MKRTKHPDGWMIYRLPVGQKKDEDEEKEESVRSITGRQASRASTMFRVRAASFFTGFAVASGIAMYQLQRDVWGSHHILSDEVEGYYTQLEKRIEQLEHAAGVAPPRPQVAKDGECD